MKLLTALLTALVGVAAPALAATDAELARCRATTDASARLACYDTLLPPPAAATSGPVTAPVFGFEKRALEGAPEAIESRIVGRFEGWGPKSQIRLENGQVWQVTDDSRGVVDLRDPKVRVTRAAFGTFFLEFEGRNRAPRVKRVE